jgi:hypothetical protein
MVPSAGQHPICAPARSSTRCAEQFVRWLRTEQVDEVTTMRTLRAIAQRAGSAR